jgi:hypothetical protein
VKRGNAGEAGHGQVKTRDTETTWIQSANGLCHKKTTTFRCGFFAIYGAKGDRTPDLIAASYPSAVISCYPMWLKVASCLSCFGIVLSPVIL